MDHIIHRQASQHHESQYNRHKFGSNGSPVHYTPLSFQLPAKFNDLRARQAQQAESQLWWPASPPSSSLQEEITAAMSTSLFTNQPLQGPSVKTSSTHPINISFVIPSELIALISSHALLASQPSPTLLEIPPNFALHRVDGQSKVPQQQVSVSNALRTRTHIQEAMQAAISTGLAEHSFIASSSLAVSLSITTVLEKNKIQPLLAMPARMLRVDDASPLSIGNLYLSSCPGKKVRLDGPVRGRSAVCRDLEADLTRMKQLGVSCIVCCLDDEELGFLGAPWPEYERCANKTGIDVLRLPTPEGLPPISASHLDGYLVDLINRYSLRGKAILVHCRGGVGRAGVIACCWMIRLGLCGWLEGADSSPRQSEPAEQQQHQATAALAFVRNVIALVRRRRSMKAIETYEQVKFLVEYVEHLRDTAIDPSV